jgi:hypothetical protein
MAPVNLLALESGVLATAAFVLGAAGSAKLRTGGRPAGAAEILVGVGLLVAPIRVSATAAAVLFAAFSAFHIRRQVDGSAARGCGCFGEHEPPGAARQASLTGLVALGAAAVAAASLSASSPPRSPTALISAAPATGAATALAAALVALAWRWAFLVTPRQLTRVSERLVNGSAAFVERRISRRTALVRLATAGSALTVAPLRYLLYPGTALAALSPGQCAGGLCADGYTAFCCEINSGSNTCPAGTFAGGWWKCTDYVGRQLCHEQGVRYYVDCNRLPGTYFPGGCHCAHDTCERRRVACNVFRYGQCNPQVRGVTEVVCRMVVCENPSRIPELNCSASLAVDNAVCAHEAPCLVTPRAVEVGPAGGV